MRLSGDGVASATLLAFIFPLSTAAAGTIDCANIVADKHTFDLSKLDGPHSVIHAVAQPPSSLSTTYTINICKPLVPAGDRDEKESCPGPTQVCAIERLINPIEKTNAISRVIPIAGDLQGSSGSALEPSFTRLKTSTSPSDQGREGLRVVLNGGSYSGRKQRAIVDFLCDKEFTGVEGEVEPEDKYKHEKRDEALAAGNSTALQFMKYGPEGGDTETDVLRLEWKTKYACESLEDDGKVTSHWGFFTWFIIIAFMGTAAYLIFGSWLNYNRYGARGWDLLPHGDTIRDVPYLLKDWSRRVFSTVQGSGSRGGYSAV